MRTGGGVNLTGRFDPDYVPRHRAATPVEAKHRADRPVDSLSQAWMPWRVLAGQHRRRTRMVVSR